jgi:hypothetical protein
MQVSTVRERNLEDGTQENRYLMEHTFALVNMVAERYRAIFSAIFIKISVPMSHQFFPGRSPAFTSVHQRFENFLFPGKQGSIVGVEDNIWTELPHPVVSTPELVLLTWASTV